MDTIQYLGEVKKRLDITSDYALAAQLGITRSAISKMQTAGSTLSDETAVKVAKILGIHPGIVMLDMHRQRAKTPQERGIWQDISVGFYAPLHRAKSARSLAPRPFATV